MPVPAGLPAQLGRYRLVRKLGEGGMGAVFLAEDTLLGRQVALKVPCFETDDDQEIVERFYREARVAAAIEHPNLCPVLDVGCDGEFHFLTMPYLDGTPLSRREKPWPADRAVDLVRLLALAVAHLHERGIVHRDLKPANVMIKPGGEPVLMDFGLARSFTAAGRITVPGGSMGGTPAYMPPEQVLGEAQAVGPATDVYALGVILYELLTGSLPFEGPIATIYGQILHAEPPPPSTRRPELDGRLDAVCLKAMAKKPEDRYSSAAEFARALAADLAAPASVPEVVEMICPACGKPFRVRGAGANRPMCPHCRVPLVPRAQWHRVSPGTTAADSDLRALGPRRRRPWLLAAGLFVALLVAGAIAAVRLAASR
jgi:serine/threonine protein kinase